MAKLTDRQKSVLRRMATSPDGCEAMMRDLLNQLVKRGLAFDTGHVYERREWQKIVSRLPVGALTVKGREIADSL